MHTCKCGSDDVNVVNQGNNHIMLATQNDKPIDWKFVKQAKTVAKCLDCNKQTSR